MPKITHRTIHDEVVCKADPNSAHYHYKSWSKLFRCPECNRTGRFNTNYLGRRRIICDGTAFTKVI